MRIEKLRTVSVSLSSSNLLRGAMGHVRRLASNRITLFAMLYFAMLIVLGIAGQRLAPYGFQEVHIVNGEVLRAEGPSIAHPLGTTATGYDVLSRVLIGAQPTLVTAFTGGTLIITIALTIGVTSGYMGGWVDDLLMRFTDITYSVPLLPFAIVLLAYLGVGYFESIVVISILLWRGGARILRSQVLQIRERSFVVGSQAMGGSTLHVISKHILPNIAPMVALYFAMGMGWAVIYQAGLAFLGITTPFIPSWGVMIRNAYNSGYLVDQIFWGMVPGILLSLTVLSAFLIGREFEEQDGTTPMGRME